MKTKECPSCAMDIPASSSKCPICSYEFPASNIMLKIIALALILIFLYLIFY